MATIQKIPVTDPYWDVKVDLAAAFQMAAKLGYNEAVANHFSVTTSDDGKQFLMNPNQRHFSLIKASDIIHLDADDPNTMSKPGAPDATAWGLHGSVHRHVRHARCLMHVHSTYATVLACLVDPHLPPLDQNSAMFFERTAIDQDYGGLALEEEGTRCARLLGDPKVKVLIMGNHGILVLGDTVADTFNRLYYFERAAQTYIEALKTGQSLNVLSDEIARKTADQLDDYDDQADKHFSDLKEILDREGSNFRE
ncbi:MAG: class II aldolase and adducin N-terminal domain-containing protein [Pseudomonadota bacterium]